MSRRDAALLWGFVVFACVGIAIYAFTRAFVWDEGFHLVAAQEILAGKRPYIDFCFAQTPLNAYWNAAWMRIFGQSWRVSHIPAVLELSGAAVLLSSYLARRYSAMVALAGAAFFLTNATQVQFGPIAQAYAMCAFCLIASFLLIVEKEEKWRALLGGVLIGCGAASSLLIAPAAVVMCTWLLRRALSRALLFAVGVLIPFAPVFWLFAQGPYQTWFNIVQYQALFRRADWKAGAAFFHDFDVVTSWFDCGQILLLIVCAFAAWKGGARKSAEWRFALWIGSVTLAYITTAHPTFSRYYIVAMPMFAFIAAPGIAVIAKTLSINAKACAIAFVALLCFGLLRRQVNDHDAATWARYEGMSNFIAKVTPSSDPLFADEHVYFLLHRLPPPGMEFSYSHKVDLPPAKAALLHIIPAKTLQKQVESGVYKTVETCDDDKIDDWKLADLFANRKDFEDCSVFYGFKGQ